MDGECFKIRDTRISRILSGKLSLQAFCLTIRPDDLFVLDGDTIYALSPRQWYARRPVIAGTLLSKESFEKFLNEPPENLSDKDRATVEFIKVDSKTCPACRYNRHKETVWKLIKKYNYPVQMLFDGAKEMHDQRKYPETDGEIAEKLDLGTGDFHGLKHGPRVECLDCVEKHVSQAYVLSCETLNGYADYLPLVVGHLCEALDELPKEQKELRATLETCLAKTNADKVPFVPLFAISPLIDRARDGMYASLENVDQTASNDEVELDVTGDMLEELEAMDEQYRLDVLGICHSIANSILGVENPTREQCMEWEGRMASLGDFLSQAAPKTSAMVRARRLMFVASPQLTHDAGYGMDDLETALRTSLSRSQEQLS